LLPVLNQILDKSRQAGAELLRRPTKILRRLDWHGNQFANIDMGERQCEMDGPSYDLPSEAILPEGTLPIKLGGVYTVVGWDDVAKQIVAYGGSSKTVIERLRGHVEIPDFTGDDSKVS
jgi:hypothetical protein